MANASNVRGLVINSLKQYHENIKDGLVSSSDKSNWNSKVSNVQGDWNTSDSSSQSYIKNKPSIPSEVTESTVSGWGFTKNTGTLTDESDPTVPSYVKNITEANISSWTNKVSNVQADWNTSDSTAQSYINNKPTIPSISGLASEEYVDNAVAGIVNSAPETLDTLYELSAALGNDPNFATTVANQIGTKVSKEELSNQSYVTETSLQSRGYLTSFTETDPVFTESPAHSITSTDITNWNNKVSNVQANWNTTNSTDQSYILNKPEIPSAVTESTVSGWGFTKNAGTITGITMNGSSKGTSGVVDLGTVLTSHQSLADYVTKTDLSNQSYLTAHQSIKTINGQSLIGTGDITISGGGDLSDYVSKTELSAQSYLTSHQDISGKLNLSGGTMTGALIAQNNTNYTTGQVRNIFMSTSAPTASDGANGDIWIMYSAE